VNNVVPAPIKNRAIPLAARLAIIAGIPASPKYGATGKIAPTLGLAEGAFEEAVRYVKDR
jgi:hypothetical protein